jgi:hypothetical protein
MKLLRTLDRRLEPFVSEMDRTLKTPVSRALTFDVFRDEDARAAQAARQPVAPEIETAAHRAVEKPAAASRAASWDCCPAPETAG